MQIAEALQVNLYAYILETEYGYTVSSMYLAQVHPGLLRPKLISIPRMDQEIELLVEHEIQCGRATQPKPGAIPFEVNIHEQ